MLSDGLKVSDQLDLEQDKELDRPNFLGLMPGPQIVTSREKGGHGRDRARGLTDFGRHFSSQERGSSSSSSSPSPSFVETFEHQE